MYMQIYISFQFWGENKLSGNDFSLEIRPYN
jgi:hypothetical protein